MPATAMFVAADLRQINSLAARGRDVAQVAFVFGAYTFEQVAVDVQAKVFGDGPGTCVGDGVFESWRFSRFVTSGTQAQPSVTSARLRWQSEHWL
jgi:hypothetical protein